MKIDRAYLTKALKYGLLGGLAGTIVMDIVMAVEFLLVKYPVSANYAVLGSVFNGGVWLGVIIHFSVGSLGGLLLGVMVSTIDLLAVTTLRRGVLWGTLAGIITIPFGCVPTALLSGVPVLELLGFSTIPHLVYGLVLGYVVGCKARISTNEAERPGAHLG